MNTNENVPILCKFDRVGDKIGDNLLKSSRITDNNLWDSFRYKYCQLLFTKRLAHETNKKNLVN